MSTDFYVELPVAYCSHCGQALPELRSRRVHVGTRLGGNVFIFAGDWPIGDPRRNESCPRPNEGIHTYADWERLVRAAGGVVSEYGQLFEPQEFIDAFVEGSKLPNTIDQGFWIEQGKCFSGYNAG